MSSVDALIAELFSDPLARGYAAMSAKDAAASLNAKNRQRNRDLVPVSDILDAIAWSEYDAASAAHKARLNLIMARDRVNANSANVKQAFLDAFAAGSATRAALIALLVETVSRATELGLSTVTPGVVEEARRIHG